MKRFACSLLMLLVLLLPLTAAWGEAPAWVSVPDVLRPGRAEQLVFTCPQAASATLTLHRGDAQVMTVAQDRPCAQGRNTVFFSGFDADGQPLAPGGYTLRLQADLSVAEIPLAVGEAAPMIEWISADHQLDYGSGASWTAQLSCSMPGTLRVSVSHGGDERDVLRLTVPAGETVCAWDGLVDGAQLSGGAWEVTFRLVDATGFASTAEVVTVEVVRPLPAHDAEPHTPAELTGVACDHDVCYWKLAMGELDESAVWEVLTQPVTVLDADERQQVKVRARPDKVCDDYTGEVTGSSQAVHVLRVEDGWALIQAYSSSVEGSRVRVWADAFTGWVEADLLLERPVDQQYALVVDKLRQRLYVYKEGRLYSTLLISTGFPTGDAPFNETPAGEFLLVSWAGGFWSGNLYCDMGIRVNDGILLHEVPCQIEVDEVTGEEERDYSRCERYLGEKASHGCIRVQRQKSPEGVNIRWLWDNLSRSRKAPTKILIWDDAGRTLDYPDDDLPLYYNPDGGRNYHSSAYCAEVNRRFLPLSPFQYGELDEKPYAGLTPCPACAPQPRREGVDKLNADRAR